MNNFYTEPGLARRLQALVGSEPVPEAVRRKYVTAVVNLFLGRGSGVAWNAGPDLPDADRVVHPGSSADALTAYTDVEISSKLQLQGPVGHYNELLAQPKFTDRPARELLEKLQIFTGPRESMKLDTELKRLHAAVVQYGS